MKKKKSEMSGLVLLLFSTLTLICGTTTSVKAQSSDNKKEIGVLKTLGKEDDILKQLPIHNLVVILVLQPVCRLCLLFLRRILTILQQQSKKRYKGM